jgi:SAM-dependent methyltransferase
MSHGQAASGDDWETHWTNYADSNERNPAQVYRRRLIEQALDLKRAVSPVRLLELGSGHGELASYLLWRYPGIELVGLDLAAAGVTIARRKAPKAVFLQADLAQADSLPAAYAGFATHAVCSEVLEHVDDPVPLLRNARALLAPGCRLVITVPAGPMSAFDRHIGHRRHFTPDGLAAKLREAGFERLTVHAAGFPFFNLYRLTVVARGAALIRDASGSSARPLPLAARLAMHGFSKVFRFNRDDGRRGWQLVAVAVEPGSKS